MCIKYTYNRTEKQTTGWYIKYLIKADWCYKICTVVLVTNRWKRGGLRRDHQYISNDTPGNLCIYQIIISLINHVSVHNQWHDYRRYFHRKVCWKDYNLVSQLISWRCGSYIAPEWYWKTCHKIPPIKLA